MYTITPGMSSVFSRRPKKQCKSCGLTIPVYRGRYPAKCPHCSTTFESASVLDLLLRDQITLSDIAEMASDEKTVEFEVIMSEVTTAGLMDYLIGTEVSDTCRNIWLYFSESVPIKALKDLVTSLRDKATDVQLYPWESDNARWVISILNARKDELPDMSGDLDAQADIRGDVIPQA